VLVAAGGLLVGCAELTALFTPQPTPLLAPDIEKPKAILFLELQGAMVPFACGGEGGVARDKGCAGKVDKGATLHTELGEGLEVTGVAFADCGAAEGVAVNPAAGKHTIALWSADSKATLLRPRPASELSAGELQRLAPELSALAAKTLGAPPSKIEVTSWVAGDFDGDAASDLMIAFEATGETTNGDGYWALAFEPSGGDRDERVLTAMSVETSRKKARTALAAAADLDGDSVLELLTAGDVWSLYRAVEGKPTEVASWFCYRREPAAAE
jgi:hypothetical protein